MQVWEVIVLGIVQGLTEFLPISSSGHLVIMQNLFAIKTDNLVLEVVVHCGTLLSVLVVFGNDILRLIVAFGKGMVAHPRRAYHSDAYFRLTLYLLLGTIPAVIVGLLWKDQIEAIFHSVKLVGITLIITGLFLALTQYIRLSNRALNWWQSLTIGIAQAIAILPGISRSGATISAGLLLGLDRQEATRFSFLLSVPAILGALVLNLPDLMTQTAVDMSWISIILGFISAFGVGYLAIRFLLRVVASGRFAYFAPYCLAVGFLILLFLA